MLRTGFTVTSAIQVGDDKLAVGGAVRQLTLIVAEAFGAQCGCCDDAKEANNESFEPASYGISYEVNRCDVGTPYILYCTDRIRRYSRCVAPEWNTVNGSYIRIRVTKLNDKDE